MTDPANTVQTRIIADTVARAAVEEYARQHPPAAPKAEIPPVLKWIGALVSAVLIALAVAAASWAASTLNALQITVARMDERQRQDQTGKRLDQIEARLAQLEQGQRRVGQ